MCGVFGYVRKPGIKTENKALFNLITSVAECSIVRGEHATGYAAKIGENYVSEKAPLPSTYFVDTPAWTKLADNMPERLIGHVRFATRGNPSDNRNNHPFQSRRYYLVHNGVLTHNEYSDNKRLCRSECDSEVILRVLQQGPGIVEGTRRVFATLRHSSFACLVLDKKTGAVYMFRTSDKPLRVWRGEDIILIASTDEILENAFIDAFGIRSAEIKGLFKWTPKSGHLYTITAGLEVPDAVMVEARTRPYISKTKPRFPYITGLGYPEDFERLKVDHDAFVCYGD